LTGLRVFHTFARGSSIRGTVTGCLRFREDHTSRGFCLSPSQAAVAWVDPVRGRAPMC